MPRYFLEVAYKGAGYSGFQTQQNARTIQGEIDQALSVLFKKSVKTTGSSRTDTGVHARQNFLHFDTDEPIPPHLCYKLNAILSHNIAVRGLYDVADNVHARFSATGRSYKYVLYNRKDPFLQDYGYYFPYPIQLEILQEAAAALFEYTDFTSFSKRNTQVKTFNCDIMQAQWERKAEQIIFIITANRFLRGMVRGLVGTMLKVGRGNMSLQEFRQVIEARQSGLADFSIPPQGLVLMEIHYPDDLVLNQVKEF